MNMDMDQKLYSFLQQIGFAADDIQLLCQVCPGLEIISAERASENIAAVIRAGYPKDDLDSLIAVNPSFLLSQPEEITRKLAGLPDVEMALRENPDLI